MRNNRGMEQDVAQTFDESDRCDACGARAWVRAYMSNGELLFCAHHAAKFAKTLQGVRVDDARQQLLAEEGVTPAR